LADIVRSLGFDPATAKACAWALVEGKQTGPLVLLDYGVMRPYYSSSGVEGWLEMSLGMSKWTPPPADYYVVEVPQVDTRTKGIAGASTVAQMATVSGAALSRCQSTGTGIVIPAKPGQISSVQKQDRLAHVARRLGWGVEFTKTGRARGKSWEDYLDPDIVRKDEVVDLLDAAFMATQWDKLRYLVGGGGISVHDSLIVKSKR